MHRFRCVIISEQRLHVHEGGSAASYSVVLASPPLGYNSVASGEVVVHIAAAPSAIYSHSGNVTLSTSELRFNSTNWHVSQSVWIAAVDDGVAGDRVRFQLTHTLSG